MTYARFLAKYLRAHRPSLVLLSILMLLSMGLQLLVPQIVRTFIDSAQAGAPTAELIRWALLFLAVALVNQLAAAISTYLSAHIGWSATNVLRTDLFRHALALDMTYHKARTPGEMIERIDGDVTNLSNFLSQFVVRVAGSLLLIVGILVTLWWEDWRFGALLTLYTVAAGWILIKRREVAIPATQLEREASAQMFGFIEERLAGLEDMRANGGGPYVMHRLLDVIRTWYTNTLRAWLMRSTMWITGILLFSAGTLLALTLGVSLYRAGAITIGTAYLLMNYMAMLEAPIDEVTRQLQEFQKAGASLRRVQEVISEKREVLDGPIVLEGHGAPSIEFQGVRFAYEEQEVLKGIDFRIEPGESLGLLGRTGSGKTTLIRLLFRLHDPTGGRILFDGRDLVDITVDSLRDRVGLVTQDVQLLQGTVRDNMTFFDHGITDDRLLAVLEELGLGQWVRTLPAGLDTPLQAGGGGLSAGEAQLLALTRVFLKDPGLVILDEASSRLDRITEKLLTQAFDRLLVGRTGIIIAHRLETVARVDKIMVLSEGRIVEFGARAELAATPGSVYHTMLSTAGSTDLDERLERLGI